MGASITGERIDEHTSHGWIGKTTGECQVHHLCPMTFSEISLLPDPDINRSKASGNVTPIMTFFTGWIDEAFIMNDEMTEDEVLLMYNVGATRRRN